MRRRWMIVVLVVLAMSRPVWALGTPAAAGALSSAGAGIGGTVGDAAGHPYLDASGQPITVTALRNESASTSPMSLAGMLMVPTGDLLSYSSSLGISLPMLSSGTMTTVYRSDGGVEHVFTTQGSSGETYVFLADQTGSNVYGIRIAKIQTNGVGTVMTAHGLNGNFTNPAWYLSAAAKAQYWINSQTAQILPDQTTPVVVVTPAPTPTPHVATPAPVFSAAPTPAPSSTPAPVASPTAGGALSPTMTSPVSFRSDMSVGNHPVTLNGGRRPGERARGSVGHPVPGPTPSHP